ncbi:MAG: hypothetical protein IE909_02075 [Campylobacterales bacterium]|nr:hypothetical protein [Campylobacterales bacterium]
MHLLQSKEHKFLDVIASYPKMKVISKRANYLRNDAIKLMEELYKEGVKFDAIYNSIF